MRSYPNIGDKMRHKKTGEVSIVKTIWWPGRAEMTDGSIIYLRGIELVEKKNDASAQQIEKQS